MNYFLNQGLGNKGPNVNIIKMFRKKKFTKRLEFKVKFSLFRLALKNVFFKRLDLYFNKVFQFRLVFYCLES